MTASAIDIHREVLKTCEAEFGQLNQVFQILDTKAQATAGLAGIFLAAAFAFAQTFKPELNLPYIVLLVICIGLLLLTVLFALLSMWSQNLFGRPTVEFVRQLVIDLVNSAGAEEMGIRATGFYGDQVHEWIPIIQRLRAVLARKSRFVICSQVSLLLSLLTVACLTVFYLTEGTQP